MKTPLALTPSRTPAVEGLIRDTPPRHVILLGLFQMDSFRQPFSFRVLSSLPWGDNKGS